MSKALRRIKKKGSQKTMAAEKIFVQMQTSAIYITKVQIHLITKTRAGSPGGRSFGPKLYRRGNSTWYEYYFSNNSV